MERSQSIPIQVVSTTMPPQAAVLSAPSITPMEVYEMKDSNMDAQMHSNNENTAEAIIELNENDVICGRGGNITNLHPGNANFRKLVINRKRFYITARSKREKRLIAEALIKDIGRMSPPGRFLLKDSESGSWYEIPEDKARDKTSQALREGAPKIREKIQTEIDEKTYGLKVSAHEVSAHDPGYDSRRYDGRHDDNHNYGRESDHGYGPPVRQEAPRRNEGHYYHYNNIVDTGFGCPATLRDVRDEHYHSSNDRMQGHHGRPEQYLEQHGSHYYGGREHDQYHSSRSSSEDRMQSHQGRPVERGSHYYDTRDRSQYHPDAHQSRTRPSTQNYDHNMHHQPYNVDHQPSRHESMLAWGTDDKVNSANKRQRSNSPNDSAMEYEPIDHQRDASDVRTSPPADNAVMGWASAFRACQSSLYEQAYDSPMDSAMECEPVDHRRDASDVRTSPPEDNADMGWASAFRACQSSLYEQAYDAPMDSATEYEPIDHQRDASDVRTPPPEDNADLGWASAFGACQSSLYEQAYDIAAWTIYGDQPIQNIPQVNSIGIDEPFSQSEMRGSSLVNVFNDSSPSTIGPSVMQAVPHRGAPLMSLGDAALNDSTYNLLTVPSLDINFSTDTDASLMNMHFSKSIESL